MRKPDVISEVLISCIEVYRRYLSGLKRYSCCRYTPTCSEYAIQALKKYGAVKGSLLAAWRILRCNPFAKGGYDPVP